MPEFVDMAEEQKAASVNVALQELANVELRSEGVQELMGRVPSWAVRYGISVVAIVVVLLFGLSALIRWPDLVVGNGVLTNADPPRQVVARSAGRLVSVLVREDSSVQSNEALAVIESAASPTAIDSLRSMLPVLGQVQVGTMDTFPVLPELDLGDGRVAWSALRSTLNELVVWHNDGYRTVRNATLNKKVQHFRRMITATEQQLAWARKKLGNHVLEASIDTALAGKGVIAATEFRRGQNTFLDQQMSASALEASLQQQHITLIELQERLNDLRHADEVAERDLLTRSSAALNAMETFVNTWQLGHELRAPIAGVVHLPKRLSLQQTVSQGDVLFTVVPSDSTFLVEAVLPAMGSGKVKLGQVAHIEPEGFPKGEYGRLVGKVLHIATMPGAEGYRVTIALPDGLRTSFHRALPFKPEMPVRVEVVTQDRSALRRVFSVLRGSVDM